MRYVIILIKLLCICMYNGLSYTRGQWLAAHRWWPCAIVVILFLVSTKLVQKTSKENSKCMFRGSWWWKPRQRKEEAVRTSKKEPQESYIIQWNWLNICCRHFFLFIIREWQTVVSSYSTVVQRHQAHWVMTQMTGSEPLQMMCLIIHGQLFA